MVVRVEQLDGGVGIEVTTNVSEALLPVSVVPIKRFPVVLLYVPFVDEVTVTAMVHVELPASVMLVNDKDVAPLVSDAGEGEPQFVYVTVVPDILTFVGSESVKLTLEMDDAPGLVIVNVSVDVPPG